MRIRFPLPVLCLLPIPALMAQEEQGEFCVHAPHDQLCATFPQDVPEFSEFFEYMVISGAAQEPFDRHAWQAFVALNWPEIEPQTDQLGWRDFPRRDAVLGRETAQCAEQAAQAEVIITDFAQSDGHPLVDRHGNYILYETRLNPVVADHIHAENLHNAEGHANPVNFPHGRDADNPASILFKSAWTVLEAPSDDYITAQGLIIVPPEQSLTGAPLCLEVTLGLVGMHIVTKVESGNGDEWIWATFEHRANAPIAADARDINAIYGNNLFPQGCIAPDSPPDRLLYDATLSTPANTPPAAAALWSATPPYAVDDTGTPLPPSQVVRCWDIFAPTQATNARWQAELFGTPLEHYMLISAQWRGANASPYIEHGELPRFLSNVTMETYIQTHRDGTCLGCHAEATTSAGAFSDFTFVLREVPE
ncbi:hypothetical protein [Gymnodinialimonas hymeniacidonis]|uniref:hypothetical protein n=1 Tax=Gymnodinialimonas hymeniacidonis TaxID=3126508 RepID=UPI0034C5DFEB